MPRASRFHLCEQGAETLLSGKTPATHKVIDAHVEMTFLFWFCFFFLSPSCQRQRCFLSGEANDASPDTDHRQKLPLLAGTGNTAQTVSSG